MFLVTHKTAYEVRISDGSSDVCSSDLSTLSSRPSDRREREPGSTDRPGTKRRNRPRLALAGRSLGRGDGLSGRRRCATAGGPAPRAARKNVVSGKRVSVRVDLGGRRLRQKQNTHQNTSQHCIPI